jgi:hypothetical protein
LNSTIAIGSSHLTSHVLTSGSLIQIGILSLGSWESGVLKLLLDLDGIVEGVLEVNRVSPSARLGSLGLSAHMG